VRRRPLKSTELETTQDSVDELETLIKELLCRLDWVYNATNNPNGLQRKEEIKLIVRPHFRKIKKFLTKLEVEAEEEADAVDLRGKYSLENLIKKQRLFEAKKAYCEKKLAVIDRLIQEAKTTGQSKG
jgi:hypothetical protein